MAKHWDSFLSDCSPSGNPFPKLGVYLHGLHHGPTAFSWIQLSASHCGLALWTGTFCANSENSGHCGSHATVHHLNLWASWPSIQYHLWSRIGFYIFVLNLSYFLTWYPMRIIYSLSPTNRWANQMSKSMHWTISLQFLLIPARQLGRLDWTSWVPINNLVHDATHTTPFYANYGFHPSFTNPPLGGGIRLSVSQRRLGTNRWLGRAYPTVSQVFPKELVQF